MKFLDGAAATKEIKRLVASSKSVQIAVAFWGDGAVEDLGLPVKGKAATVICNLKSGGTNPKEIRKLMGANVNVLQCDTLHGKVYIFDECVVIGSSNASSNGLALQGEQLSGWHEANLITYDPAVYSDAVGWFRQLIPRKITSDDLEVACELFKRRRAVVPNSPAAILVDEVREHPERFKDKGIYINAYGEWLKGKYATAEVDEREKAKIDESINIGGYGYNLPSNAQLIDFYVGPRGAIKFLGFWKTSELPRTKVVDDMTLYFAEKTIKLDGISQNATGPIATQWKDALIRFREKELNELEYRNVPMEFWEFYQKYLCQNIIDRLGEVDEKGHV